jgi:hypothetical protein
MERSRNVLKEKPQQLENPLSIEICLGHLEEVQSAKVKQIDINLYEVGIFSIFTSWLNMVSLLD